MYILCEMLKDFKLESELKSLSEKPRPHCIFTHISDLRSKILVAVCFS